MAQYEVSSMAVNYPSKHRIALSGTIVVDLQESTTQAPTRLAAMPVLPEDSLDDAEEPVSLNFDPANSNFYLEEDSLDMEAVQLLALQFLALLDEDDSEKTQDQKAEEALETDSHLEQLQEQQKSKAKSKQTRIFSDPALPSSGANTFRPYDGELLLLGQLAQKHMHHTQLSELEEYTSFEGVQTMHPWFQMDPVVPYCHHYNGEDEPIQAATATQYLTVSCSKDCCRRELNIRSLELTSASNL